jgi:hypothetical protein
MGSRLTGIGLVMLASVLFAMPAHAGHVLFVDDDNSDGFQCTNAPYQTIGAALAAASDGDEIHVCPGVYVEQVHLSKRVRILGEPFGTKRAVIKPTGLGLFVPSLLGGTFIAAAVVIDTPLARISDIDIDLSNACASRCWPGSTSGTRRPCSSGSGSSTRAYRAVRTVTAASACWSRAVSRAWSTIRP